MEADRFRRIRALFDTLADLPAQERRDHLQRIADIDEATRRQLVALIDAHEHIGDAPTRRAVSDAAFDPARRIGERIGAYRIERELGHGGMGSVYLAHRDDGVEQTVAIKIVRPELVDDMTLARFRLERQVLAWLRHPNIAAMLDLGETSDGSPYVVMEYIDGVPVTAHARGLDIGQRLKLFLAICDAVAYAHRNMIVHRDIKPGNVLVDAQGQPKLLDFGIAKPLVARIGAVDVERTGTAQQFFSIYSAAPEQLRGDAITVACDVYGLGALLYELLAGRPALVLDGLSPAQIEARILDHEPALPSSVTPLDADLDAIVLRCLRKKPEQRYASVEQLADDVERYLSKRPVLARRGQWTYRAGRFVARHRLALAAAAVVAAVVVASGALLWRQYRVAIDERARAEVERSRAEAVAGFILDTIEAADPGKSGGKDTTVRQLLELVGSRAMRELTDQPIVQGRLAEVLISAQLTLGNIKGAVSLLDAAQAPMAAATSADPTLRNRFALLAARVRSQAGDYDAARRLLGEIRPNLSTPDDVLAWESLDLVSPQTPLKHGERTARLKPLYERWHADETVDPRRRWQLANSYATALEVEGKLAEAAAIRETLIADEKKHLPPDHPTIAQTLLTLAQTKYDLGDTKAHEALVAEASSTIEKVYGTRSTVYASLLDDRASIAFGAGRVDEAIEISQNAIKIQQEVLGVMHSSVAYGHFNLGAELEKLPDRQELAERHLLEAARIADAVLRPQHMNRFYLIGIPGAFEARTGRYDKAIAMLTPLVDDMPDDLVKTDMHCFLDANLALARYGKNPTPQGAAALRQKIEYIASCEPSPPLLAAMPLLRDAADALQRKHGAIR
jgi:serine/threonine-protein kinase